jgi:thiamine monophosphate synthase
MNKKNLFEIKKFTEKPVFFTDRKKVLNFERVIEILPKGSTVIIREYDLDEKSRENFARKISVLASNRGLKILVGKDFILARKIKADGVHFSDFDKLPLQFFKKKSFPKKFIFSLSCHSLKSVLKSAKLKPEMIFISPIFPTTSHNKIREFGLKNLAKIAVKTRNSSYFSPKIYGLGGVNSENLKSLRKLAISGFAAIDFFQNNS